MKFVFNPFTVNFDSVIEQDLSDYWKNDGTSTATGDWDIGDYKFTAKKFEGEGEIFAVGDVDTFTVTEIEGDDFPSEYHYFIFEIYAYRIINGKRLYSETGKVVSYSDDGDFVSLYSLLLEWNEVSGADGYRIIIIEDSWTGLFSDAYFDVEGGTTTSETYYPTSTFLEGGVPVVIPKELPDVVSDFKGVVKGCFFEGDGGGLTGLPHIVTIVGERSGSLNLNDTFAMGNGINGGAVRMPFPGEVIAISMFCRFSESTSGRVALQVNGAAAGLDYRIPTPGVNNGGSHLVFAEPLLFTASSRLNCVVTTAESFTSGITVSIWVRMFI